MPLLVFALRHGLGRMHRLVAPLSLSERVKMARCQSFVLAKLNSQAGRPKTYDADHLDRGLQVLLLSKHRLLQLLEVFGEELDLLLVHLGGVRC